MDHMIKETGGEKGCGECMYCQEASYCIRKKQKIADQQTCLHYVNVEERHSIMKSVEQAFDFIVKYGG